MALQIRNEGTGQALEMTAHLSGIGIKAGILVGPNCKCVVPTVTVARNSHVEVVGDIHRAVLVAVPAMNLALK